MRALTLILLLLLAFAAERSAQAQTWSSPYYFSSDPYVGVDSTCSYTPQDLQIEYGAYETDGPIVVYRVANLLLPPPFHITLRPWHITVYPQYPSEDFSVWVCQNHAGNAVWNCVDGSDNGPGLTNSVTVPAQGGVFYVIVAGSVFNYATCGPYTIVAQY
jgi:hypothetical protein